MTRCHLSSFHQDSPKTLVKLQDAHWKPLLSWIRDELGLEIRVHESIFSADQPEETKIRLGEVVKAFDEWQLAGTSSLIIASLIVTAQIHNRDGAGDLFDEIILDRACSHSWTNRCRAGRPGCARRSEQPDRSMG